MTHSLDLRKKALEYLDNGGTKQSASTIFGVTTRTLSNWIKRQKNNCLAAKARRPSPSKIDSDKLREHISNHPDDYLREIAKVFHVTTPAIYYACKRLKITLKKRPHFIKKEMK